MSCTYISFILNMATLMPDVASQLFLLQVLTLWAVDKLQKQTPAGEFHCKRTVGVHIPPPSSLRHHPGATSHTLGLPAAPGSMRGAGNPLASAQNIRSVTEILNSLDPPCCGGNGFVVAILQFWWRRAPGSICLTCLSVVIKG